MAEETEVVGAGQEGQAEQASEVGTASQPPSSPPAATPPTPPEVQAEIDRRVESERRRLQSVKDREVAAARQEALRRERALRETLKAQLVQAGQDPQQAEAYLDQQAKLQFADAEISRQAAEQQALAEAQVHIRAAGLHKYGVKPDDPRLYGKFETWEEYDDALDEIRRAEEGKARAAQKEAAEQAEQAALQKRIESGELSTLGGAPAGTGGGPDLSKFKITDSRELYRLGLQQEQAKRGRK